jgi:hypothetical protein
VTRGDFFAVYQGGILRLRQMAGPARNPDSMNGDFDTSADRFTYDSPLQ